MSKTLPFINRFLYIDFCNILFLYIPIVLHHVHGVLEPLSRMMRTTFTRGIPLHDYRYFSTPHSEMTVNVIPERVQLFN